MRFVVGHAARRGVPRRRKLSPAQEAEVCRRYDGGESGRSLAARFSVGKKAIDGALRRGRVARRGAKDWTALYRALSDSQVEQAATRYQGGESVPSIAADFGVSSACVRESLARVGIHKGKHGKPPGHARPDLWTIPGGEHPTICAEYLAGKTCKDLAQERGVVPGTIKRILKRNGIEMRRSRKPLSKQQESDVCARYLAGETPKTISDATGIARSTIWFVLKRNSIEERQVVKLRAPQKAEARRMYEAGEKIDAIVRRTGVSAAGVYLALKQFGYGPQRKSRVLEWEETRAAYAIRRLPVYRRWREAVLKRDGHACRHCGSADFLHVHHLLPFVDLLAEHRPINVDDAERYSALWDVDNGVTLCGDCHRTAHSKVSHLL